LPRIRDRRAPSAGFYALNLQRGIAFVLNDKVMHHLGIF
jgi:hypothetical protein